MTKKRVDANLKGQKRAQRVYEVALSGVAAALAFALVAIAMLVRYGTIAFFIAAGLAVAAPLAKKYYFASVAAYVAASLLCLALPFDIMSAMGFIVYFGPMSIASGIMFIKKVKPYISYPVKAVYISGALAFMYYVADTIMINEQVIGLIPYWAVAIVGLVALLLIDLAEQYVFGKMSVVVGKVMRDKRFGLDAVKSETTLDESEDNSPFDDEENGDDFNSSNDNDAEAFGADADNKDHSNKQN